MQKSLNICFVWALYKAPATIRIALFAV